MCDYEENPCAYCPYGSEAMDSTGHIYYQCDLDDGPEYYLNSVCTNGDDDD